MVISNRLSGTLLTKKIFDDALISSDLLAACFLVFPRFGYCPSKLDRELILNWIPFLTLDLSSPFLSVLSFHL